MAKSEKDIPSKLKDLGISVFKKAKEGLNSAKTSVENTILEENLRHRFNLENPYRFVLLAESKKTNVIDELSARHAKRYDEDDIFVFFGKSERSGFEKGKILRDISNSAEYIVKEVTSVTIPIEYNGQTYDSEAFAVSCEAK